MTSFAQPGQPLTDREREVLACIALGEPTKRIVDILGVTRNTAESHVRAVIVKLGASNRAHAVHIGMRMGVIW